MYCHTICDVNFIRKNIIFSNHEHEVIISMEEKHKIKNVINRHGLEDIDELKGFMFLSKIENFESAIEVFFFGKYKKIDNIISDVFIPAIKLGVNPNYSDYDYHELESFKRNNDFILQISCLLGDEYNVEDKDDNKFSVTKDGKENIWILSSNSAEPLKLYEENPESIKFDFTNLANFTDNENKRKILLKVGELFNMSIEEKMREKPISSKHNLIDAKNNNDCEVQ